MISPYVVLCGQKLNNISSVYAIVGSHTYQVNSITDAIDICFCSVKVFQKPFSRVSSHVWQFLERYVYGFAVPNLSASVSQVIDKLRQL